MHLLFFLPFFLDRISIETRAWDNDGNESMKQYTKSELDKVVKETVRETVDSITPPPLEESWARF
ncbi:hypothetical protein, partial [Desulfoscipio geothermicus]